MDAAIDLNVYTVPGHVKLWERPKCDYCGADAVVAIKYTTYEGVFDRHMHIEKHIKYMCASHYDAFEFGTAMGIDYEKEWL
jgi:hypothetical protein